MQWSLYPSLQNLSVFLQIFKSGLSSCLDSKWYTLACWTRLSISSFLSPVFSLKNRFCTKKCFWATLPCFRETLRSLRATLPCFRETLRSLRATLPCSREALRSLRATLPCFRETLRNLRATLPCSRETLRNLRATLPGLATTLWKGSAKRNPPQRRPMPFHQEFISFS